MFLLRRAKKESLVKPPATAENKVWRNLVTRPIPTKPNTSPQAEKELTHCYETQHDK